MLLFWLYRLDCRVNYGIINMISFGFWHFSKKLVWEMCYWKFILSEIALSFVNSCFTNSWRRCSNINKWWLNSILSFNFAPLQGMCLGIPAVAGKTGKIISAHSGCSYIAKIVSRKMSLKILTHISCYSV